MKKEAQPPHEPDHNRSGKESRDSLPSSDGKNRREELPRKHGTTDNVREARCKDSERRRKEQIERLNLMNRIWNGED